MGIPVFTSIHPAFQQWLDLQSRLLNVADQAMLLKGENLTRVDILAAHPLSSNTLSAEQQLLVSNVYKKNRMQMHKLSDGRLWIGLPVQHGRQIWGVFLVLVKISAPSAMTAVLKKINAGLVWLNPLLHEKPLTDAAASIVSSACTQSFDTQTFLAPINQLLNENSLREAAIYFVNALATQLNAKRVAIAFYRKQQLQIEAISFSAHFDPRTQAMKMLVSAMEEASEQKTAIHFLRDDSASAQAQPRIETVTRCHQQLAESANVQSLHSFLIKPVGEAASCSGVLLFEMAGNKPLSPEIIDYIEQLLVYVAPVFLLKISAEASALSRLHSTFNKLKQKYVSRYKYGNKLLAAVGVLALLSLFVPVPYQVTSDARLQGAYKNLLVSPQEGFLGEIKSRPGDLVKKGQVLAKLADEDLQLEHQKIASQLQQYQQEYDNALANGNRVQAAIANAQIDQASAQLQLIEQQMLRTQLIAPNDGVIVSDDISQNLGAPVKQGQVLFEIAAAKGYLVQLYVDERDISNIQLNQTGTVKLASLPNEPLHFSVVSITPISQVKDGRNYFRVEGRLVNESAVLRPGMTGTGKITAGYHALGWVWFHDVWHWLMLKFWW